MKTMKKSISIMFALIMIAGITVFSQSHEKDKSKLNTYVIERDMPGAGDLTEQQLVEVSQLSNSVIKEQGPKIEWLHSYVTVDKIYCVYKAKDEEILKEHAEKANFPITAIKELATVINPETATALVHY